jgi:tetratricopeptide (TPR) repeat protein
MTKLWRYKKVLEDTLVDVVASYFNKAALFTDMGDFEKCEDLLKQALHIVGSSSVELSFAYAEIYRYQGINSSEATRYDQICLDVKRSLYGSESDHVEVADCLYGLGMVCVSIGSYDVALSYVFE